MCLAIPGKVVELWQTDETTMVKVDFGGTCKEVSAALVPDLAVGDYTVVHVGFALQRLDEETAQETLALFESFRDYTGGFDPDQDDAALDEPLPRI